MALRNTSTVLLSISILMASTGLAQAGFIWLAPEQGAANSSTYSRQAEPPVADGTQLQGRQWPVDSAVPVVGTQPQANMDAAAMAPAPLAPAEAQTLVSPPGVAPAVEASVQAPAPAPVEQVQAAPVQVAAAQAAPVLLKNETVSGSPMVSPGDQPISAPVVAPAPAVESAPAAMSTFTAPPAQPEVTLGSARSDSAVVQQPAAPGMPTAENLINSMPSMTSPTPAAMPAAAPVEATPAMLTPVTASPAPAPAPAASLATAEPLVPPPGVAASAPNPTTSGNAVSLVTGENVATQAPASAPVAPAAKVIDGFGKQVPLVIAMRQILPSEYGFAHREGVDLGQLIDWQGGRPWPQVLSDALAPIGVKAIISGDTVLLEKGVVAAAVVAPAQEAPRARLTDTTVVQTR